MSNAEFPQPDRSPDEERLVVLLERFRPRPTGRFYRRMASAPWRTGDSPRRWYWGILAHRRILAAATLVILVTVFALFVSPSLAVVARQLMRFFAPNPSASMVLQVTVPSPGDPGVFGSPDYFSLSLAEAEELAGFELKEVPPSAAGAWFPRLEFAGAHYDPEMKAAVLRYKADNRSLFFTQRQPGPVQEFSSIGPNARVEIVPVRGVEGEYVAGGWRTDRPDAGTPQSDTQVNLDVIWDPALPQRILRWQEENIYYEILISAALGRSLDLGKDDLVKLAEIIE
jgi:hypothetical protein